MRKALLIIAIVVLALVPFGVYALIATAPARAVVRAADTAPVAQQDLTPEQQADLEESFQKMLDLRKETINTMVQDGLLTEEQGQLALERLDRMAEDFAEDGTAYGYGALRGCFGGPAAGDYYGPGGRMRGYDWDDGNDLNDGYYGRGMMRGYGWN